MNFTERKRQLLKTLTTKTKQTKHGLNYEVFSNAPDTAKLREEDKGKRVWVCSRPRTHKLFLKEVNDDHYILNERGSVPDVIIFKDEGILHPSEWKGRI